MPIQINMFYKYLENDPIKYIQSCSLNGTDLLYKKKSIILNSGECVIKEITIKIAFFPPRNNSATFECLLKAKLTVQRERWHPCQAHFNGQNNRSCI